MPRYLQGWWTPVRLRWRVKAVEGVDPPKLIPKHSDGTWLVQLVPLQQPRRGHVVRKEHTADGSYLTMLRMTVRVFAIMHQPAAR